MLIADEEIASAGVDVLMAGIVALRVGLAGVRELAIGAYGEDGDGIMQAIGGIEPFAIGMDADFRAVAGAGEAIGQSGDDLLLS